MPRLQTETLLARFGIHGKQLVDLGHDRGSYRIPRIQLDHIGKATPRVRPAPSMHHSPSPNLVIGLVGISLQNAMKVFQKLFGAGTISPQAEVEYRPSSWSSVLPQKRLMVLTPSIVHLHIDGRPLRLPRTCPPLLPAPHRPPRAPPPPYPPPPTVTR